MTAKAMLTVAALAAAGLAGAAAADEGGRPYTVAMTGAAERPGPGDPDGTGTATFRVNVGQGEVCYTLAVANLEAATAAHLHRAPPTAAGPVVVHLAAPTNGSS